LPVARCPLPVARSAAPEPEPVGDRLMTACDLIDLLIAGA